MNSVQEINRIIRAFLNNKDIKIENYNNLFLIAKRLRVAEIVAYKANKNNVYKGIYNYEKYVIYSRY